MIEYTNIGLSQYSSMRVGGIAAKLLIPDNEAEFIEQLKDGNYIIFGRGTNLIFSKPHYDNTVICTSNLDHIEIDGELLTVGCGATLVSVSRTAGREALSGFESLSGIPGSVGGAVYMNAGAYGSEISDILISARFYDKKGGIIELSNEQLDFSYRYSRMQKEKLILLSAKFKLMHGDYEAIKARVDENTAKRREKQPLDYPSCGSAFKRPINGYASELIERCGLKGYTVGGAQISKLHAGFLINKGDATTADVIQVLSDVKEIVFEKTGVRLEEEIKII